MPASVRRCTGRRMRATRAAAYAHARAQHAPAWTAKLSVHLANEASPCTSKAYRGRVRAWCTVAVRVWQCERECRERIIRACVTTPDRRKSVCRSKTTCTQGGCTWGRSSLSVLQRIGMCGCNVAARPLPPAGVPPHALVSTREHPLGSSGAPTAWHRCAPTSTRRRTTSCTREYP